MRAIVYERYGPPEVLQLKELEKPAPKPNELLIRIHATSVTSGDWRARSLQMPPGFGLMGRLFFGVFGPRQPILGTELSGVVEAVGGAVRNFKPGDEVFAFPGTAMGCYAEYRCMPEDGPVALKPARLTHEEAAALPFGGINALLFLRRGKIGSGERVLVNGASGAVGTAVVQLARHFGAEVTGVCSASNADLVKSLGASRVFDYATQDFTRQGGGYDIIVDTVGTAPYSRIRDSLKNGGRLLAVLAGFGDLLRAPWVAMTSSKRIIAGPASCRAEDLSFLAELAQNGKYRAVIDRRYALEDIIQAHRYLDTGRKKGSLIITLTPVPERSR